MQYKKIFYCIGLIVLITNMPLIARLGGFSNKSAKNEPLIRQPHSSIALSNQIQRTPSQQATQIAHAAQTQGQHEITSASFKDVSIPQQVLLDKISSLKQEKSKLKAQNAQLVNEKKELKKQQQNLLAQLESIKNAYS